MVYSKAFVAFLFCFVVFLFGASDVSAQGAGIKIIPATIETNANPGDVLNETIVITNVSDEDKTFYLYKRDIKGVEDGGVPVFADEGAEPTGFELSQWLSFGATEISMQAGTEYRMPITITVPQDASPGSHFGGIFVSAEPPRLRQTGAGVGYEVASIVSIRIAGAITDSARVRSISTDKLIYGKKDVTFDIRLENQGNILIRPRGPLVITNMFGGEVGTLTVNESQAGVFPGTMRDISVNWTDEEPGFGKYEALVALAYEGDGGIKTIDAVATFWIFPMKIILPIIAGLLALIIGLYFFTRMYINNAVARNVGGRRIVSRRQKPGVSRFMFVFVVLLTVSALFLIALLMLIV